MKTMTIEIPEGKKAEWVDGVLTLVDEQPKVETKFKVGDRVQILKDGTFQADNKATVHLCKGSIVTIMDIKDELCLCTYQGYHCKYNSKDLLSIEPKVEVKFNIGDKVVIKEDKSIVTVVDYFEYNGKQRYRVQGKYTTERYESELEPYTEPKDITERIKTFEDAMDWCEKNGFESLCDDFNAYYKKTPDILAYLKLRIITCALNEGWEPAFENGEHRFYLIFNGELTNVARIYTGSAAPYTLYFKTAKLAEYAANQFKDIYMDFCYKGKE